MKREKFLKKLGKEKAESGDIDPFTEEALKGAEHLGDVREFERLLSEVDRKIADKWNMPAKINWGIYVTAIAATLVGMVLYWFLLGGKSPDADQLYSANFSPFPNTLVNIERGMNDNNLEVEGMVAYNQRQYETALMKIEKILNGPTPSPEWYLYYGISAMETRKLAIADKAFKKLIQQTTAKDYQDAAVWYSTLLLIKTKKFGAAKNQLRNISQSNSFYQSKAQILLDQLR